MPKSIIYLSNMLNCLSQDRLPRRLPQELDRARRAVFGVRHRGVRRRQAEGRVPRRVEQVPQREAVGGHI